MIHEGDESRRSRFWLLSSPFVFTFADWRQRWKVRGLAVFGSLLRSDFGPSSDVDLLVTFEPDARWSLIDHVRMEQEIADIIGRHVDLVSST